MTNTLLFFNPVQYVINITARITMGHYNNEMLTRIEHFEGAGALDLLFCPSTPPTELSAFPRPERDEVHLDVDGTLVSEDLVVSQQVVRDLLLFEQCGGVVGFNTGRSISGLEPIIEQLPFTTGPRITEGGAVVGLQNGKTIYDHNFAEELRVSRELLWRDLSDAGVQVLHAPDARQVFPDASRGIRTAVVDNGTLATENIHFGYVGDMGILVPEQTIGEELFQIAAPHYGGISETTSVIYQPDSGFMRVANRHTKADGVDVYYDNSGITSLHSRMRTRPPVAHIGNGPEDLLGRRPGEPINRAVTIAVANAPAEVRSAADWVTGQIRGAGVSSVIRVLLAA
jgi:hypothetical protein